MEAGPLDRLRLTDARLAGMADGLRTVAALPDPVGEVLDGWTPAERPRRSQRVRVPLGVVAIIYENRPNVTSDAAGLCLKSGNAALLRGSSSALRSNLADRRRCCATRSPKQGLPEDCVLLVDDTAHETAIEVMQLTDYVDCLIPRGGPVADPEHPRQRDRAGDHRRRRQLPRLRRRGRRPRRGARRSSSTPRRSARACATRPSRSSCTRRSPTRSSRVSPRRCTPSGVELVGDDGARGALARAWARRPTTTSAREFLDAEDERRGRRRSLDAAIDHVNRFGTGHTEAILTRDLDAARALHRARSTPPP